MISERIKYGLGRYHLEIIKKAKLENDSFLILENTFMYQVYSEYSYGSKESDEHGWTDIKRELERGNVLKSKEYPIAWCAIKENEITYIYHISQFEKKSEEELYKNAKQILLFVDSEFPTNGLFYGRKLEVNNEKVISLLRICNFHDLYILFKRYMAIYKRQRMNDRFFAEEPVIYICNQIHTLIKKSKNSALIKQAYDSHMENINRGYEERADEVLYQRFEEKYGPRHIDHNESFGLKMGKEELYDIIHNKEEDKGKEKNKFPKQDGYEKAVKDLPENRRDIVLTPFAASKEEDREDSFDKINLTRILEESKLRKRGGEII